MAHQPQSRIFTEEDIPMLLNILNPVAYKYSVLGLQLRIPNTRIFNIEHNYSQCEDRLRIVITERLKQEEPLTLCDVATALRAESVNEGWLAGQLEAQYFPLDQSLSLLTGRGRTVFPTQTSAFQTHVLTTSTIPSAPSQAPANSNHTILHGQYISQLPGFSMPYSMYPQPSQSILFNHPNPQFQSWQFPPHNPSTFEQFSSYNHHVPMLPYSYAQCPVNNLQYRSPHHLTVNNLQYRSPHHLTSPTSVHPHCSTTSHMPLSTGPSQRDSVSEAWPAPNRHRPEMRPQPQLLSGQCEHAYGSISVAENPIQQTPTLCDIVTAPRAESIGENCSARVIESQSPPLLAGQKRAMSSTRAELCHMSPITATPQASAEICPPPTKTHRSEMRLQPLSSQHEQPCSSKLIADNASRDSVSENRPNTQEIRSQPPILQCLSIQNQQPCSSKSLTNNPVKQFIDFVKTTYRSSVVERDTSVVKWPPTPSKVYINLACIDRKRVKISEDYEKLTVDMVQDGCVDAIRVKKGPIEFSEIANGISLTCDQNATAMSSRRLILVEGAPGVGKSTFAWEFCRRWERGEIAQQYQLVLLLRLRDNMISEAKSLQDLLYHPSKSVSEALFEELVDSHNFHPLIILEGYDELPDNRRNGSSVFNQLISGKLLPSATVLVTSRPWATQKIRTKHEGRIHQHIEVLGFTRPQVTEYIRSTVPEDEVSGLEAYMERHPQIRMGMYIPLNSAIVVTVYQESQASGLAMPTTLTELYSALAITLLLRYLHGHPEYENVSALNSFSDLPEAVHSKFNELCRLAYSGIDGSRNRVQLIFKDLPSNFDSLGFMDSVTELYVTRGAVSSHNFLHLTFQEFFAAVHISNLPQEKHLDYFQRHKEGRLKVVLRFLAGLNKLNCFTKDIVNDMFKASPPLEDASKHQVSCDLEVDVDFINWMYEAQSDDVIELLLGQKTVEFSIKPRAMLLMDYYYLGYCIVHSHSQWVLSWEIKEIDEERVKLLTSEASTQALPRTCCKVVGLRSKQTILTLSTKCFHMLFTEWKNVLHLRELSLCLQVACDRIPWPDLSTLQFLRVKGGGNIKGIPLSLSCLKSLTIDCKHEQDLHYIADFISHASHLNVLCICVKTGLLEVITRDLASNTVLPLERLEMSQGSFSDIAVHHMVQFITHTETLQYLSITESEFSAHGLLGLAKCLHQRPTLQVALKDLKYDINCDNDAEVLVQLQDHYPDIVNFLKLGNSTIKGISDVGAKALAQALKSIDMITLNLSGNDNAIGVDGVVALAEALHHNSTLEKLVLGYISIGDDGAEALAKALCHNSTLKELRLYGNDSIGKKGTHQLIESLALNKSISHLSLPSTCWVYAQQSPQYHSVQHKVCFA